MTSLLQQARTYMDLGANPYQGLQRMYERHGSVCLLHAGPFRFCYLLGPEANRFVFANSELFHWREAFDVLIPVDGETALIVSDGDDHKRRRRLVQPAFVHRRIAAYVETFRANADAAIDGLRDGNVVDVYQLFRRVIRRSTIQALFGERLARDEAFFGDRLQAALDLVDGSPLQLVRRLGTPAWRRAQRARAEVDQRVYAEIERRRKEPAGDKQRAKRISSVEDTSMADTSTAESSMADTSMADTSTADTSTADSSVEASSAPDTSAPDTSAPDTSARESSASDVLSALLAAADEDGSQLADTEIRDQVISLIAAGYETTSAAMAWAVYALLTNDAAEWDTLHKRLDEPDAPYLDAVVSETLRLYPPAVISARWSIEDFEFGGVRVPARSFVFYSPYVTHRLPELWPEPERFDPRRWLPDDPRYRKPGPHEFLPFGGGPHRCIGAGFATTELRTLLEQLVRRTRLELVEQRAQPRPTNLAAMRPRDGLLVRVTELR